MSIFDIDDELNVDDEEEVIENFPIDVVLLPVKFEYYDTKVIDVAYPIKGDTSKFMNRVLLFKFLLNKNATNKDAYNLIRRISLESDSAKTNTVSLFDNMIFNQIIKPMELYDEDKLLFEKDNTYLEYILSGFVSLLLDISMDVKEDADPVFKNHIEKIKLLLFNIYMATLVIIFTNDYEGYIMENVTKITDKYNFDNMNKCTLEEMSKKIPAYKELQTTYESNAYVLIGLYTGLIRNFYVCFHDIYENKSERFMDHLYHILNETDKGSMIFNDIKHGRNTSEKHYELFESYLLDYKNNNLFEDMRDDLIKKIKMRKTVFH